MAVHTRKIISAVANLSALSLLFVVTAFGAHAQVPKQELEVKRPPNGNTVYGNFSNVHVKCADEGLTDCDANMWTTHVAHRPGKGMSAQLVYGSGTVEFRCDAKGDPGITLIVDDEYRGKFITDIHARVNNKSVPLSGGRGALGRIYVEFSAESQLAKMLPHTDWVFSSQVNGPILTLDWEDRYIQSRTNYELQATKFLSQCEEIRYKTAVASQPAKPVAKARPVDDRSQIYLKSLPNGGGVVANKGGTVIPCTLDTRFRDCELDVWTTHVRPGKNSSIHMIYMQGEFMLSCFPRKDYVEFRVHAPNNNRTIGIVTSLEGSTLYRRHAFEKTADGSVIIKIPLKDTVVNGHSVLSAKNLNDAEWAFYGESERDSRVVDFPNDPNTGYTQHLKMFFKICNISLKG